MRLPWVGLSLVLAVAVVSAALAGCTYRQLSDKPTVKTSLVLLAVESGAGAAGGLVACSVSTSCERPILWAATGAWAVLVTDLVLGLVLPWWFGKPVANVRPAPVVDPDE